MLEAALLGLINVLKCFECNQFRLDFVNTFGEGLLHYAAKGNQKKMTNYLLLRGCDPNVCNKFNESPIFIAAEMGSMSVLHLLYNHSLTKVDIADKFGDTIMHFAARDGQIDALQLILEKTHKLITRKN